MSSGTSLSAYTGIKLRLASVLENLLRFSQERNDEDRSRLIQDLLADLSEDNFRLAVFGKYNRGKSTLMNALLGMERLPTGVLPLTSVVTTVRHDSQERVLIQREGWSLPQEISLAQLPDYVTENGNPGNEKKVTLAQIFLPSELLRSGFFFIDTPGVGSNIIANTKAAEGFIGRADAALVVMSVESPLDEAEWQLLQNIYEQVGKIFVVLNKADLILESERETISAAFASRMRAMIPDEVPVFVLSARNALARGKQSRTPDADLQKLIEALLAFMAQEKTGQFLKRMAERIENLINQEKAIEYLFQQEPQQKQKLIAQTRERTEKAKIEGTLLLQALREIVPSNIHSALGPHIEDWQEATLQSLVRGDSPNDIADIAAFLKKRGLSKPGDFLLSYSETMLTLDKKIRKLGKVGPATLGNVSDRDPGERIFGSAAGADIFNQPRPFAWDFRARLIARFHLASVPLFRRLVIRPSLEHFVNSLYGEVEQILNHRIDLILEEYQRAINRVLEHTTKVYMHSSVPAHGDALTHFFKEVGEAMREACETGLADRNAAAERTALRERSPKAHCALCDHLTDIQLHFMAQYQYRLLTDPQERVRNAERGGLCAFHTWVYESIGSPQGVCGGYSLVPLHLASKIENLLKEAPRKPEDVQQIARDLLGGSRQCLACEVLQTAETQKLNEIAGSTEGIEGSTLCAPHLCRVILRDGGDTAAPLLEELVTVLRRLGEDMQQFALKQSGIRYSWTSAGERAAHLNALRTLVGAKPLSYIKNIVEI